jgi:tRNA 2-thiouridine synthesizing protein A
VIEMTEVAVDRLIDARGIACPGPLMSLIGAVRQGQPGDVLEVWSTDAGSRSDIPAWVAKAKHELVSVTDGDGFTSFVVRRTR